MTPTASLQPQLDSVQDGHGDDPPAAAARLHDAAELLAGATPAEAATWVRLCEHVLLCHLDDAARLRAELARVPAALRGHALVQAALERAGQAMAWADDLAAAAPPTLAPPDQVRALCTAAQMHVVRARWGEAAARIHRAAALAALSDDACRPYAANMNNMALELRVRRGPLADEAAVLMLDCARRSCEAWGRVGGWMEAERAEYQLARCHARVGDGERALVHARLCHEACEVNEGDALERFFGHEALVHACVAARRPDDARREAQHMRALCEAIPEADRPFAEEALAEAVKAIGGP